MVMAIIYIPMLFLSCILHNRVSRLVMLQNERCISQRTQGGSTLSKPLSHDDLELSILLHQETQQLKHILHIVSHNYLLVSIM